MGETTRQQYILKMRNKYDRLDLCQKQNISNTYLSQILHFQLHNFKARNVRFHAYNDYQTYILISQ